MNRLILSVFAVFGFIVTAHGQAVYEATVEAGEKWVGIFAGDSYQQPFDAPFSVVTGRFDRGGFCVPCAFSSTGRYIESAGPSSISFDGNRFTIISDSPVEVKKGGRTLRQAYLSMHHRGLQSAGVYPSRDFFTLPLYETKDDLGLLHTSGAITDYARRLMTEGYPKGIMVIADGWSMAAGRWDFDPRGYPDPAATIDLLHRMGFKVMLTVTPYLAAWGRDFAEYRNGGTLVTDPDGEPLLMRDGNGYFAAVDLTSPQIAAELKMSLERLRKEYSIDGFRFDCLDMVDALSGRPEFINEYLSAAVAAVKGFPLTEMMPGMPEFQTDYAAAIRVPRKNADEHMLDIITVGLAAGPFIQMLPTATENGSERGIVRCALMQMTMPVARVPFAPWRYGAYAVEIKRILEFRSSIAGYMGGIYDETCKSIEPVIRPMEYLYGKEGFADCTDQYMLGDKYLIAPSVNDTPRRLVRLPRGTWRYMNGKVYRGPAVTEIETDGYKMIWFELQ